MKVPILMADVIDSSKQDAKLLIKNFKETVDRINKNNENLLSPLTITLGDEFQGLVKTVEEAVKIIFDIEEFIVETQSSIKLRYVINYGEIDTNINTKIAYEMLGEGLTEARERLNGLKNEDERFLVILDPGREELQKLLNKSFILYQNFVDSWKPKDYEIVSEFFKTTDYRIVADKVKIDRSNAWRRRKSLNIKEYETIKEIILTLIRTKE